MKSFLKIQLQSSCTKTSQGSQLAYKSPSFHSAPYLLWALLSHLDHPSALQPVWQDFHFLQVSEMIQYK